MPFATKQAKIKIQGSLETLRHLTFYWLAPYLGKALSSMILKWKKIAEIKEKGKGKAHNLLGTLWRILEVKVLHHSQEHAVIFLVHAISPLDITV